MRVKYFAWFDSKSEKTQFIKLINSCRSDIEAVTRVMDTYPDLSIAEVQGIVDNFKTELNKP